MMTSRYTDSQILSNLKQAENGTEAADALVTHTRDIPFAYETPKAHFFRRDRMDKKNKGLQPVSCNPLNYGAKGGLEKFIYHI
jgi:hypothetical protein